MDASTPEPIVSPVVVEPIATEEKLGQLLRLQTQYPEPDFKETLEPEPGQT